VTFQRILSYTLNSIIKKIVTVLFLIVGLIMTGHAILTPLLMVIVMIAGDFLAMSLTTDNVQPSSTPNAWRIGRLTIAGAVMAICLLAFCSGVLAFGKFEMRLEIEALRTLAFTALVFGSQAIIYAIRERRHLWRSRPSLWLALSSVADVLIASALAIGGIAMTPLPALVVAATLAAAIALAIVLDLVKVPVFARLGITESRRYHPLTHETRGMAKTEGIPMIEPSADQPKNSDPKTEAKAASKPAVMAEPQPDAKPEPQVKTKVATVLNTSLGDLPHGWPRQRPGGCWAHHRCGYYPG
jgi:H+-transporting ATPase